MALDVETGEGLPTADAYLSVADADAYHAARDTEEWFAASLAGKEAAILEATAFLDGAYSWVGEVQFSSQALGWPRVYAYDHEGRLVAPDAVPRKVMDAAAMLAAQALGGALQPSTSAAAAAASASAGSIKRKKVGPLELEYFEGGGTAAPGAAPVREFPEVNTLLRGLYRGSSKGISGSVVRYS